MPLLLFAACVPAERGDVLSSAPSFRAKNLAIAAIRGSRGKGVSISRELVRRLEEAGLKASSLEESDSVLAGSALGLEVGINPALLDEIRRATGADAIVFLTLDPNWRSLEVSALNASTGDAVLRSSVNPRGDAFTGAPEIAAAAARALAFLAAERRKPKASTPDEPGMDDLPLP